MSDQMEKAIESAYEGGFMRECKHKLEFGPDHNWMHEDVRSISCSKCNEDFLYYEELKEYTIISKADIEEIKAMYCPNVPHGYDDCGKCVVCRLQGDL